MFLSTFFTTRTRPVRWSGPRPFRPVCRTEHMVYDSVIFENESVAGVVTQLRRVPSGPVVLQSLLGTGSVELSAEVCRRTPPEFRLVVQAGELPRFFAELYPDSGPTLTVLFHSGRHLDNWEIRLHPRASVYVVLPSSFAESLVPAFTWRLVNCDGNLRGFDLSYRPVGCLPALRSLFRCIKCLPRREITEI